jgi:hypothetical protein
MSTKSVSIKNTSSSVTTSFEKYLTIEDYTIDQNIYRNECAEREKKIEVKQKQTEEKFNEINTALKTCVYRDPVVEQIKSIIYFGDIRICSTKKFSKLTKWLYKKLFGWMIEDIYRI